MIRGAYEQDGATGRQLPRVFPTAQSTSGAKPLHAANENRSLGKRNSQRTAVWSGVSKPRIPPHFDQPDGKESREYGRRRALTEMEDLTNVAVNQNYDK